MWRFRDSASSGPFRITLTTRGIAASIGAFFGRASINTNGEVRVTKRIPGVGLYETKKVHDFEMPHERRSHDLPAEDLPADR